MKYGHLFAPAALLGLSVAAGPINAQSPPSHPSSETRMDAAAQAFEKDPQFRLLSPKKRQDLVKFVVGNTLFALVHEFGHATISEMGLPVLGREEDAADAFAAVVGLKTGTTMSQGVLIEATKGWFYADRRDRQEGNKMAFYDEHGIDKQRAYNVVCLMVGSDPEKFKSLADMAKMPEERQATCVGDYSNASWSWDTVLKPHRRKANQPKTTLGVSYQKGEGRLAVFAEAFRHVGMLESVAEHASDSFAWRAPFMLEMQSCGESNAHWDISVRKIIMCYEIADEFAQLYLGYGEEREAKRNK